MRISWVLMRTPSPLAVWKSIAIWNVVDQETATKSIPTEAFQSWFYTKLNSYWFFYHCCSKYNSFIYSEIAHICTQ
ncbi:unnamed protein product [Blepharisma stoltei]|uniref:Secreted protein n=1 Tax=Blepharisma stoltei TaxID=1481888 RepID=A0AAU9JRA5_9CILI|nr:unnamed protein product [Blepharisma stoltei]